jgi:hypothetical protein
MWLLQEIDRDARPPAPGKQTLMQRIRSPCCARSGHAATPSNSMMNWRRLIEWHRCSRAGTTV